MVQARELQSENGGPDTIKRRDLWGNQQPGAGGSATSKKPNSEVSERVRDPTTNGCSSSSSSPLRQAHFSSYQQHHHPLSSTTNIGGHIRRRTPLNHTCNIGEEQAAETIGSSPNHQNRPSSSQPGPSRKDRNKVIGLGVLCMCLGLSLIGIKTSFLNMRIIKEDTSAIIGGAAVDGHSAAVLSPVAAPAWSITDLDTKDGIYDYSRNTTEIYGSRDHRFWGPYAEIRRGLDYDFHSNYVKERQAIQDDIIQTIIERGSHHDGEDDGGLDAVKRASPRELGPDCRQGKETNQWVVFTAGPMGAGKSHTLRWLSKRGFFPLNEFVVADPDTIRNELPEIEGYIKADPQQAGSRTHREAGYILEILIRVCLYQGRKVLVQGSLRDSAWHAAYFNELKTIYPGLKIAIIHVTAAKETVLERARRRGETTKRVIPDEVLLASVEQTPKAVAELAPLVDYCVTIDNESEEPTLVTQGETWKHFSALWRDCRPFPPKVIGDENSRNGGSSSGYI